MRRTPSRNICEQDNALPTLTRQERTPDRKWTSDRRPTRTECRLVSRENMNLQSSKYVHPRGSVSSPIKKRITRLLPGRFACFATIAIDWNVGRIAFSVGAQFCGQRVREWSEVLQPARSNGDPITTIVTHGLTSAIFHHPFVDGKNFLLDQGICMLHSRIRSLSYLCVA